MKPALSLPRAIISWITTPFYLLIFLGTLLSLHPLFVISNYTWRRGFWLTWRLLNWLLMQGLALVGCRPRIHADLSKLPTDRPLLIVSNHQSLLDIPVINQAFGSRLIVWVAKQELGKWLPSISFVLRNGAGTLINRSDTQQAMEQLMALGAALERNSGATCIFPEGTRSRDGKLRKFKPIGIQTLVEAAPRALIVPVVLDGSWELLCRGMLPIPFGVRFTLEVLEPIEPSQVEKHALAPLIHQRVSTRLEQLRALGADGTAPSI